MHLNMGIVSKQAGSCGPESPFQAREASCEVNLVQVVLSHMSRYISSCSSSTSFAVSSLQLGMSVVIGAEGFRLSQLSRTIHHEMVNRLSA
jgi:hypothetical protein